MKAHRLAIQNLRTSESDTNLRNWYVDKSMLSAPSDIKIYILTGQQGGAAPSKGWGSYRDRHLCLVEESGEGARRGKEDQGNKHFH